MERVTIHRGDTGAAPPFPYDEALARERAERMASVPAPATTTAIASGSWFEVVASAVGIVASALGLIGRIPVVMACLAVLAVGAAMFAQAIGMAIRWNDLLSRFAGRHARSVSLGIGATLAGGTIGIILGALALAGVAPLVLVAIAAIVFGLALIFGGPAQQDVVALPPEAFRYEDLGRTSSGLMVIVGVASTILGVVAMFGVGPVVTLGLIAMLIVGGAELVAGATLSSKFQRGAP
jgi:hypothetical protein